ncbi:TetR/AcrR family transcriptional regulator [Amycolatopsis aidingensis]|uniref:TetR/AcrR family transcriptional regulator n=1 Tax=Amycolatopsis aidingensis TaxID=2842453 RepID=UPI001C0B7ABE|nr:TetR/AcrR family transcriptional regulator [Amycolatopsis aidingensis]
MVVNRSGPTRDRIRRAAVKLFAEKGFHGTGIRDLAQEARLSSASLYHYVGNKEDLLAGIMQDALRALLTAAQEVVAGVTDPVERLGRLVALHVITHAVQREETTVVDNEVRSLSPDTRQPVVKLRDAYERLWAETIREGQRAGVFHTDQPSVTRLALLEMCNGVARWYSPRGVLGLEQLAGHYARLALRAVGCIDPATPDLAHCRAVVDTVWAGAGSGR